MADQPKPPLWRVMEAAAYKAPLEIKLERAAEIRALADWLVPEESHKSFLPGEDRHDRSKRQQRRHLRQTLLAEADRAEAGDG